ncbi:hypothetical protein AVEN_253904-1 [Araneus ventricosus]|uniref:Uncharacterized protein n=1 Tax=Araneus ventricosus TaxID=182803 RepID=A0A4Y2EJM1_ARAVE|nr:hypothetical protein AVEN_253904-1 [Araneus ventricosus]
MKINNDELFDEVVLAKEYLQSNWELWKQEETTRDVIISSEEKWLRLFGHFKENRIAAHNLIKKLSMPSAYLGHQQQLREYFL